MKNMNKYIYKSHKNFMISPISLLDIGARWGLQRPWSQYPIDYIKYYGFDADKNECDRLNKINKNKNIKYINAALSDEESEEILYVTKEPGRSSIFKPNTKLIKHFYDNEGFDVINQIPITTTTLNKVIEKEVIKPDFMKLDVQGAELKIIKGSNQIHSNILGLEIEVEFIDLYEGQPLFSEVNEYILSMGMELYDLNRYWAKRKVMKPGFSQRGQIIFADAIYFRSHDSFFESEYSNEKDLVDKLLKLINVLSLYGFFDSALDLLNHEKSPVSNEDKNWIINNIESFSKYNAIQKLLLNNVMAEKSGRIFQYLSRLLSYKQKNDGWGTDYNNVENRYGYFLSDKLSRIFGKK
jgi:FkbM family methyltransferase